MDVHAAIVFHGGIDPWPLVVLTPGGPAERWGRRSSTTAAGGGGGDDEPRPRSGAHSWCRQGFHPETASSALREQVDTLSIPVTWLRGRRPRCATLVLRVGLDPVLDQGRLGHPHMVGAPKRKDI
jgi:hypothetical protein